jgi:hypothetical protein
MIGLQAAIVNSQTLEEVARLEKVHLFAYLNILKLKLSISHFYLYTNISHPNCYCITGIELRSTSCRS